MKKLLGAYGYDTTLQGHIGGKSPGVLSGTEKISQYEILDTALHNWRVTPQEERQMLRGLASPPFNLPKGWETPIDTHLQNQYIKGKQVELQNEPQGNYMAAPIARERENQTDPNVALARGKKEVVDGAVTTIGSMGGAGVSGKSPRAGEPVEPANAPHRGAPPEPISVAETQPGPARSTPPPPPSGPVNSQPSSSGKPIRTSTSANAPKGGPSPMPDAPAKPREQWQQVNASNRQGGGGGDSNRIPDPAARRTTPAAKQTAQKAREELADLDKKGKFIGDRSELD